MKSLEGVSRSQSEFDAALPSCSKLGASKPGLDPSLLTIIGCRFSCLERGSSSAEGNFRRKLIGPGQPDRQRGGINSSILEGVPCGSAVSGIPREMWVILMLLLVSCLICSQFEKRMRHLETFQYHWLSDHLATLLGKSKLWHFKTHSLLNYVGEQQIFYLFCIWYMSQQNFIIV